MFLMTVEMGQILLLSDEEISALLTGVSRLTPVLLDVFLELVRVIQDLPALETDHLAGHRMLGVVSPETRLLDKLPGAEFAVVVFLSG